MTLKQRILSYIMDPNVASSCWPSVRSRCMRNSITRRSHSGTVGVVFILIAAFALNLLPVRFAAIAMIIRSLCALRRRSQVRQPRSANHWRNCAPNSRRPVSGRRAHPRNASPSAEPRWPSASRSNYYRIPDEHRRARSPQQSCHRANKDLIGENRNRANHASASGKSVRHGELWDAVSQSLFPPENA